MPTVPTVININTGGGPPPVEPEDVEAQGTAAPAKAAAGTETVDPQAIEAELRAMGMQKVAPDRPEPRFSSEPASVETGEVPQGEVVPSPEGDPVEAELRALGMRSLQKAPATLGEQAVAAAQGAVSGAVSGTGALVGMAQGAKYGFKLSAAVPHPLLKAGAIAGGGLIGGVMGIFGAEMVNAELAKVEIGGTKLTFAREDDVPQEVRAAYHAGSFAASAVPFMGAPFLGRAFASSDGVIATMPGFIGNAVRGVIDSATKYPYRTILQDVTTTVSATIAGGIATDAGVGPLGVAAAELVFGGVNIPNLAVKATRSSVEKAKNLIMTQMPSMQKNEAARMLQGMLIEAGDDPKAIADALAAARESGFGGNLPSHIVAGNATLTQLANRIALNHPDWSETVKKQVAEAYVTHRDTILAYTAVGTPEALQRAAQAEVAFAEGIIAAEMAAARKYMEDAADAIVGGSPGSADIFGKRMAAILNDSRAQMENLSATYWKNVPGNLGSDASTILKVLAHPDGVRKGLIQEDKLDGVVESVLTRFADNADNKLSDDIWRNAHSNPPAELAPPVTTVEELRIFRERALRLMREAKADRRFDKAFAYSKLANAAMDDMAFVARENLGPEAIAALDIAIATDKRIFEVFDQGVVGAANSTTKMGDPRVAPEVLALHAADNIGKIDDKNFQDMVIAASMGSAKNKDLMLTEQQEFLRWTAQNLINPVSGRVKPEKLARYLKANEAVLERFPELRAQLKDAASADRLLAAYTHDSALRAKEIKGNTAFGKLVGIGTESAVNKALASANPAIAMREYIDFAKQAGPEAGDVLLSTVITRSMDLSKRGEAFSFREFRDQFFGTGLAKQFQEAGILSADHATKLSAAMNRAIQIEAAVAEKGVMKDYHRPKDLLQTWLVRLAGMRTAGKLPFLTEGVPSLTLASGAGRIAEAMFDKIPFERLDTVILNAFKDPHQLELLLRKDVTPHQKMQTIREMNAYIWAAGTDLLTW